MELALPVFLFCAVGVALAVSMVVAGRLFSPKHKTLVKDMPYESGMNPFHDTHRRFDVRFHLVAISFLVFDVELLFLYPWAVATTHPEGLASAAGMTPGLRLLIFTGALLFLTLLTLGLVYDWRKGVFKWR